PGPTAAGARAHWTAGGGGRDVCLMACPWGGAPCPGRGGMVPRRSALVTRRVRLLELQARARPPQVGPQHAADRLEHAVEEQPVDARVVVEVLEVTEVRDGAGGGGGERLRAGARHGEGPGGGPPPPPQPHPGPRAPGPPRPP